MKNWIYRGKFWKNITCLVDPLTKPLIKPSINTSLDPWQGWSTRAFFFYKFGRIYPSFHNNFSHSFLSLNIFNFWHILEGILGTYRYASYHMISYIFPSMGPRIVDFCSHTSLEVNPPIVFGFFHLLGLNLLTTYDLRFGPLILFQSRLPIHIGNLFDQYIWYMYCDHTWDGVRPTYASEVDCTCAHVFRWPIYTT